LEIYPLHSAAYLVISDNIAAIDVIEEYLARNEAIIAEGKIRHREIERCTRTI